MGAAHPLEEAHAASLRTPARAALVLEGLGTREKAPEELTGGPVVSETACGCMLVQLIALRCEVSMNRRAHWERVYTTMTTDDVSWFQPEPTASAELLQAAGLQPHT